ncbi:MAG: 1-acyl-sn-glycerol-3-phosphate acyltransferase [Defluviitaleaceae bacterium]|nr:1-acyl-sn-glycerol-3-phosphate acyltransferase [Defluviitaleaceae bacterium]
MKGFYRFAIKVVGPIYRVMFRFRVTGLENVPTEGGVILCANHRSNHDTLVMAIACKRQLHFLAKYELWRSKILGKLCDWLGAVPVNRDKPGVDSLKRIVALLKEGRGVGIFMQGGRRAEIDYDDVKAGVALFAIKGRAVVVPVNISSSFKLFAEVHINIGQPISFEELWDAKVRTQQLNEAAQEIIDAIAKLGDSGSNPE